MDLRELVMLAPQINPLLRVKADVWRWLALSPLCNACHLVTLPYSIHFMHIGQQIFLLLPILATFASNGLNFFRQSVHLIIFAIDMLVSICWTTVIPPQVIVAHH